MTNFGSNLTDSLTQQWNLKIAIALSVSLVRVWQSFANALPESRHLA